MSMDCFFCKRNCGCDHEVVVAITALRQGNYDYYLYIAAGKQVDASIMKQSLNAANVTEHELATWKAGFEKRLSW